MLIFSLPKGLKLNYLGVLIIIILVLNSKSKPLEQGVIKTTIFDVGQGLAILIKTQNYHLLFDTGFSNQSFSVAKSVINPFLNTQNIKQLDTLIISHGDIDHSGGVKALQPFLNDSQVLVSDTRNIPHNLTTKTCKTGFNWQIDGVNFELLNPPNIAYKKDNNNSCVLKVSNEKYSILLTGDIEKKAEKHLLKTRGKKLKSNILIVPHHGSKTSSSLAFLQAVSPSIAINSSGFKNRFNHPHPKIKQRYLNNNITFYDTQCSGQISMILSNSTITLTQSRLTDKRYWIRQCQK